METTKRNLLVNSLKLLGKRGIKWLFIGIVASMGIALVELSISIILQLLLLNLGFLSQRPKIYHYTIPNYSLYLIVSLLGIVAIIRFCVQLTSTQTSAFLRDLVSLRLRKNTVYQMLFSQQQEARIPSKIHFKISEVFVKSSEFIFNFSLFVFMGVQSIFLFLILSFTAWKETCLAFLGIALIGTTILFINKNVSKFARQIPLQQKKLNEGIEKIARNFIFVKLMKKRENEYKFLHEAISSYASKSIRANFFSNFATQTGPLLGILLLVFIVLASQSLWHTEPLILISFIYLFARFVQSLSILSGYFGNMVIYIPQYKLGLESITNEDFNRICQTEPLPIPHPHEVVDPAQEKLPWVVFDHVHFSYQPSQPFFKNINLEIPAGFQVGIMGVSGTGKSTLLMLISGILRPTSGQILINKIPAHEYVEREDVRMGYVGVEPFLIKGTLRENLCYGSSISVSDGDISNVLKLVSLDSLIAEKGLDYELEEDQSGLSAGQKQRICLARAVLNKPHLLILDEATANLDEHNEHLVAKVLKDLKHTCTTLIVSHRPGILVFADRVIQMGELLGRT